MRARSRRFPGVLALLLLLAGAVAGPTPASGQSATSAEPAAAWIQLGPDGPIARTVGAASRCADLETDLGSRPMVVRALPSPAAFPVLVCEAPVTPGAAWARVGGLSLSPPRAEARRILVLGDTGCRIQAGSRVQHCDDTARWPLARLAASAADWQPDLVIHVGDYVYREAPCPGAYAGCAGSPWGDTWATWQADFFGPAAPLLRAAPWVFVRGNHELCEDGVGAGWFRLLEPRPLTAICTDYTEPFAVALGDLRLLVMDVALADDYDVPSDQVSAYQAQYEAIGRLAGPRAWLLQHQPLWGIGDDPEHPGAAGLFRTNAVLDAALPAGLPSGVEMVLAGHLHMLEALGFADRRPVQWIVGNSGTERDPPIPVSLVGQPLGGTTVAAGMSLDAFGFVTLEPAGPGWSATARDVDGSPQLECQIVARQLSCSPVARP